jgi:hypothetical protein
LRDGRIMRISQFLDTLDAVQQLLDRHSPGTWPAAGSLLLRHSGAMRSIEPGVSRFSDVQVHIVVRVFDAPRNDKTAIMPCIASAMRQRATGIFDKIQSCVVQPDLNR